MLHFKQWQGVLHMVKKLGMVLLCAALGSTVNAREVSESQKFIGVEVSITEVQGKASANTSGSTSEGRGLGLRLGAENEQWRTMFILGFFDDEGRNVEKLLLSIDYFFIKTEVMDNYLIQPYLGLNFGYMNYESKHIDADGFLYGAQGGMVVDATEQIGLDLGYRYSLSSADELDHTGEVIFGLNYKY